MCTQDYKYLCAAVPIRATTVKIQTDRHTHRHADRQYFDRLIWTKVHGPWYERPDELKTTKRDVTQQIHMTLLTCSRWQRRRRIAVDILYTASRSQSLYTDSHPSRSTAATCCPSGDSGTAYNHDQTSVRSSQTDTASSVCLPGWNCGSAGTHRLRWEDTDSGQWWRHTLDLMIRDCRIRMLSSTQQYDVSVCWLISIKLITKDAF